MNRLKKLLYKLIYLFPRLILFGVIMFSLVITLAISVEALDFLRPSLNDLRKSILSMLGM